VSAVRVERSGDRDPACPILDRDHLVGVVFDPDRRSALVEILKDEPPDPDPGHLDIGHDVASAYAVDSAAPIELLALAEEVTRLLRVGDRKAAAGRHSKCWVVV
jgi:hypothetical protein